MLIFISCRRWDVKEIMSQHNPYVDKLVGELKIVTQRLEILGEQRVPELVQNEIWTEIIQQVQPSFFRPSFLFNVH